MNITQNIETIIRNNYHNPRFGVKALAEKSGFSVTYLREMIYHHYQTSPQKLIENIRLEKALIMLSENHRNLYKLARQVGYQYPKTFRQALKRRLHITPSTLQALFRQADDAEKILNALRKKLWRRS